MVKSSITADATISSPEFGHAWTKNGTSYATVRCGTGMTVYLTDPETAYQLAAACLDAAAGLETLAKETADA